MSNANRDAQGRWSSANVAVHTSSDVANGGAPNIADAPSCNAPGAADAASFSGSETPAARGAALSISDGSADDWGGPSQTDALLNRPAGGKGGGGMGDVGGGGADKIPDPDYEANFAKLRFGGPDLGREVLKAGTANSEAQAAGRAAGRDAAMRAGGYGGNEGPGMHTVSAPGGRAGHGADVPGSGVPGPAEVIGEAGAGEAAAGGAEAAGAASGLAELTPLALL